MQRITLIVAILAILLSAFTLSHTRTDMRYSELIEKIANGEQLTPTERQELVLEAQRQQDATTLLLSLVQPGTQTLQVDHLITNDAKIQDATIQDAVIQNADVQVATVDGATITNATLQSATAGGGDVLINTNGIQIKNTSTALLSFARSDNLFGYLNIGSTGDKLGLFNNVVGGELDFYLKMTDLSTGKGLVLTEDGAQVNRVQADLRIGAQGSKYTIGGEASLNGQGASGGATYAQLGTTTNTPPTPVQSDDVNIYIKGNKIVFMYNDAGTVRYKYLDLSGTGVTWVHTTVAP